MSRLALVTCLFLSFFFTSSGQKSKRQDSSIVITYFGNKNPFRDSAFLTNVAKVYGDNATTIADSLLKDTAFINKFDTAFLWTNGEFVSSGYKIHLPIKYLSCTSDYEHIFSKKQKAELDSLINKFNSESTFNIVIVTIDSSWTNKTDFDDLIKAIHHNWGVEKKSIRKGIVIGLSKGLRLIRIDNGPGISEKLSDIETKNIIDNIIIPEYKQKNYFDGTRNGLLAIIQKLR